MLKKTFIAVVFMKELYCHDYIVKDEVIDEVAQSFIDKYDNMGKSL